MFRVFRWTGMPAALAVLVTVAACGHGTPTQRACTLIGCDSGITIMLSGTAAASVTRVEVSAPGDTTRAHDCTSTSPCTGTFGVWFANYTPATVTVHLVMATDSRTYTITPTYKDQQPNGPDCPPVCHQATLSIDVA
ncbi:MAG TPA: hypothetical protein VFT41_06805 [Gemmatimonadaceae bacterium]|nr:hypothetical protein [Gemmatimonadaceae bacterium]